MDSIDDFLNSIESEAGKQEEGSGLPNEATTERREQPHGMVSSLTTKSVDDEYDHNNKRKHGVLDDPSPPDAHKRLKPSSYNTNVPESARGGRIVESEVIVSAQPQQQQQQLPPPVVTATSGVHNIQPPPVAKPPVVVVDSADYYAFLTAPVASFPSSTTAVHARSTTTSKHVVAAAVDGDDDAADEVSTTRSASSSTTADISGKRKPIAIKREAGGQVWVDRTLGKYTDDYNLFVGNLAPDIKEDQVRQVFAEYPSLSFVRIVVDSKTGKGKGYAFVGFKDPFEMLRALREKHDKLCGARPMQISKSKFSAASQRKQ